MGTIRVETVIEAPPSVVFDLARDVTVHAETTRRTGEKAVAGVISGKMGFGDVVTFEAKHFGVKQRLTSKIVEFDYPHSFTDQMVEGAFQSLRHQHIFESADGRTRMIDVVVLKAPLGPLGWLAERLFLDRYMRNFLVERGSALKAIAERPADAEAGAQ